jgi:hypothetical protein
MFLRKNIHFFIKVVDFLKKTSYNRICSIVGNAFNDFKAIIEYSYVLLTIVRHE